METSLRTIGVKVNPSKSLCRPAHRNLNNNMTRLAVALMGALMLSSQVAATTMVGAPPIANLDKAHGE